MAKRFDTGNGNTATKNDYWYIAQHNITIEQVNQNESNILFSHIRKHTLQNSQKLFTPDLGEMEVVDEIQVTLPVGDLRGEHQVYQKRKKHISCESLKRTKGWPPSHTTYAKFGSVPSEELSMKWWENTPTAFLKQATFSNGLLHWAQQENKKHTR